VSVTSLMAAMAAELATLVGERCIVVLDAYFAVGPVFLILKQVLDNSGRRLIHIVTKAKRNAVGYEDPPPKTGSVGRPRKYGRKLTLLDQFEAMKTLFEDTPIEVYGQARIVSFLCLDLIWKPIKDKVRFVLVCDGSEQFILMCSDLTLSAPDIIKAYSCRFKIEVNFKVLKHLMGVFFYHFWTTVWPRIGKKTASDLKLIKDERSKRLIKQTTNAIEGFVNMGCIATGILQILSMSFQQKILEKYTGWLRTGVMKIIDFRDVELSKNLSKFIPKIVVNLK
jgi:hypothetical protein